MKKITKAFSLISLSLVTTMSFGQMHNGARIIPLTSHSVADIKKHGLIKSASDTITTFRYNSMDSIQVIGIPITPVTIPNSARNGWNFGINVIVKGSKLDTVGVFYYSQSSACTNTSITNALTSVGEYVSPEIPNVNSFVTGLYWFNDATFLGNDSALTWPQTNSIEPGLCSNSAGYYWYNQLYAGCSDTAYFPVQDLGIYTSITYNSGSNAFIDYVDGDEINYGMPNFVTWYPALYMNSDYTLADTTFSPFVEEYRANTNLATNATVTFDTVWDYYSQGYISPITAGSVKVDTIWAAMEYFNSSHTPDTVIFQVCSVTPSGGFPHRPIGKGHQASVIYGADSLILKPAPAGIPIISNDGFVVGQNYPNPFNKTTEIDYALIKPSDVNFLVCDITGRVLISNVYANSAPGKHSINLSANSLSPGVYFYTFNVDGLKITKSMVISNN